MTARARALLGGFAVLGLAASTAASWVHYHLLVNPDYSSFCDVNATISCKQAYLSRYGSIAGMPVALGGVIFFGLVLLLLWAARPGRPAADSAGSYIFALSTLGLAVVMYLAYASFVILREVCPLCVTTYVAVIGTFIVSGGVSTVPLGKLPGRGARDLRALLGAPLAWIVALLFIGASVAGVSMFQRAQAQTRTAAAAPVQPLAADQKSEFERWWDLQPVVAVPFKADGAKVLVVKFNDYQCPPCRQTYYAYESILSKYAPSDVKYLLQHFPLDPACNPSVRSLVHPAACAAAAGAVMAGEKGKLDQMTAWFFAHQDELSPATVRRGVEEVAGITDFDARFPAAIKTVEAQDNVGGSLGVNSTPTFFINGRKLSQGIPPQYFQEALDLELKRATK